MLVSFKKLTFPKQVNHLLRKYGFFIRIFFFPRKLIICLENMILLENIICSKNVNHLLRKYDLFDRKSKRFDES